MNITVTGHRLLRHNPGEIKQVLELELLFQMVCHQHVSVNSGMALGFDQLAVEVCLNLGIKVCAYVPCLDQEKLWSSSDRMHYNHLIMRIKQSGGEVIQVSDQPYRGPTDMEQRNRAMVDNGEMVIAYWSGDSGGTANCVTYAMKKTRQITNLWKELSCPLSCRQ